MTGLRLEALAVDLGAAPLVRLDTGVAPGVILTLMGPSGSGKSTALAAILGTLEPAFAMRGRVLLAGTDLTGRPLSERRIGVMFQDDLLFPHLSVAGNLAFALPPGIRGRARQAAVEDALAAAELPGYGPRDPAALSTGQRARVSLMRALLAEPRGLLLDEPFARLDVGLRGRMRDFVFGLIRDRGLPTILVTHDPEDARAAGGSVLSPLGTPVAI
jgi:putative thiamine transport system ATP-binding protein